MKLIWLFSVLIVVPFGFAENVNDFSAKIEQAEQGDADAQFGVGLMYFKGQGVSKDFELAHKRFLKCAKQGSEVSQALVGLMYHNGQGVLQDYQQAHKWYNIAAANGNEDAAEFRDELAEKMTAEQIAEAQKLAREWVASKAGKSERG